MTRERKIELIKKFRPFLYAMLENQVPNLIADPDNASNYEIFIYNNLIDKEAKSENNFPFKRSFSF